MNEEIPIYWTVQDPDGYLMHKHVSIRSEEAIKDFLKSEQAMNVFVNAGRILKDLPPKCTPSWEHFLAEGYSLVQVKVVSADG